MIKQDTKQRAGERFRRGILLLCFLCLSGSVIAQNDKANIQEPTLGLENGFVEFETPYFNVKLVKASQTIAALKPKGEEDFSFTPSGWLEKRDGNGYYHLGDLTLRLRSGSNDEWTFYSTAVHRQPVKAISVTGSALAAANLAPTLSSEIPLQIVRTWKVDQGTLVLNFQLTNKSNHNVEIGAFGIPMVFNNILSGKNLEQAHAQCVFYDPYVGRQAGYLQVTRLTGHGPALLVLPAGENTSFEAYRPLLDDPTPRGITFEGFYAWMTHTKAYAQNEWEQAEPWNSPTSVVLKPEETRNYGVKFVLADSIPAIESTLIEHDRPVAIGLPGYVLPKDLKAHLFLKYPHKVQSVQVTPKGAISIQADGATEHGWQVYQVQGEKWGRARLTVTYDNGLTQSIHYKVIKPQAQVVDDLGHFLMTEQWFQKSEDPFNRNPSVMSYDYEEKHTVEQENRAWIAGLSDEGGAGSWLAAIMKQLVQPDKDEINKLQKFIDEVLWGGIQYKKGGYKYGVRKSLFYYAPDSLPNYTYNPDINYGGWSSWDIKEARSVDRSYNYVHVATAYWVFYRLARNHEGLVTNHPWQWYLKRAYHTSLAMVKYASYLSQFGQMEGTVFLFILRDLQREGWHDKAETFEKAMRSRAEVWKSLAFPFGSEMPWDSTGQEEVYAWCLYFGLLDKAQVTINAILGYMPALPHWAYNGSARRYWDFLYAGKLSRIERQLHHYGSGLNAIPILTEYRRQPKNMYMLRVGYGGLMGSISNITKDGFGPAAFHAYPSTLKIDTYSGDYGSNFFGYAVNNGTYIVKHPEFGWISFGGNLIKKDEWIQVKPITAGRSRVYIAPLGLWLQLDAGQIEQVVFNLSTHQVSLELASSNQYTPEALLRIKQTAPNREYQFIPVSDFTKKRGVYRISLHENDITTVILTEASHQNNEK